MDEKRSFVEKGKQHCYTEAFLAFLLRGPEERIRWNQQKLFRSSRR